MAAAAPTAKWADEESPLGSPTTTTSAAANTTATAAARKVPTLADLRRKWKNFGPPVENESNLVAVEKSVFLELGSIDKLEKDTRDEIFGLLANSMQAKVEVPLSKLLKAFDAKTKEQTAAVEAAIVEPQPSGTVVASPASSGASGKTWAQVRQERKEAAGQAAATTGTTSSSAHRTTAAAAPTAESCVVRIRNLVDDISPDELRRIFGPENGLGEIKRLFLARDQEGNRRGYAYVTYGTATDAAKAIAKLDKKPFKHVVLVVDYGTPSNRPDSGSAGGGGRGGGGRGGSSMSSRR